MAGLQKKMIHKASCSFLFLCERVGVGLVGEGWWYCRCVCAHVHECMCSVSRLRISVCIFPLQEYMWHSWWVSVNELESLRICWRVVLFKPSLPICLLTCLCVCVCARMLLPEGGISVQWVRGTKMAAYSTEVICSSWPIPHCRVHTGCF